MGRNTQLLGQDLTVTGCLVQHVDEVGVLKDILNFTATQQILDVLGDAGRNTTPLTEPLPDFHGISCSLLLLQEQMELVHVVTGGLLSHGIHDL